MSERCEYCGAIMIEKHSEVNEYGVTMINFRCPKCGKWKAVPE